MEQVISIFANDDVESLKAISAATIRFSFEDLVDKETIDEIEDKCPDLIRVISNVCGPLPFGILSMALRHNAKNIIEYGLKNNLEDVHMAPYIISSIITGNGYTRENADRIMSAGIKATYDKSTFEERERKLRKTKRDTKDIQKDIKRTKQNIDFLNVQSKYFKEEEKMKTLQRKFQELQRELSEAENLAVPDYDPDIISKEEFDLSKQVILITSFMGLFGTESEAGAFIDKYWRVFCNNNEKSLRCVTPWFLEIANFNEIAYLMSKIPPTEEYYEFFKDVICMTFPTYMFQSRGIELMVIYGEMFGKMLQLKKEKEIDLLKNRIKSLGKSFIQDNSIGYAWYFNGCKYDRWFEV